VSVALPEVDIAATADGRMAMSKISPAFFGAYYLGRDYAAHQARWYDLFRKRKRLLLLAPRDHGKTEAVIRVYAGSRICTDRSLRVLIVSKTKDVARRRVDQVRIDLEGNTKITADFGTFAPRMVSIGGGGRNNKESAGRWTSTQFYVSGRRNSRDPTMEGVGVLGAITGGHFDLIILDDPIEYNDAQSQSKRDAVWKWFQSTIEYLAEPTTRIIVIGTKKHADDLYGRIANEDDTFDVVIDKAVPDVEWLRRAPFEFTTSIGTGGRELTTGVKIHEPTKVLWEDRWPIEALLMQYRKNSVVFARESQNEMMDDAKTVFKRVYFTGGTSDAAPGITFPGCYDKVRTLCHEGEKYRNVEGLHILQAWDLALVADKASAEASDSDFTVGLTIGYDPLDEVRFLLGFYRGRGLLPSQVQKAIKMEASRFGAGKPNGVRFIAVENNAFGKLHQIGLQRSTDLPIVPHHTDRKKADPYEGVPRLVGLLENGKWIIPRGDQYSRQVAQLIENEFVGLGVEAHDDIPMTAWIMECLVARYKVLLENMTRSEARPSVGQRPSSGR